MAACGSRGFAYFLGCFVGVIEAKVDIRLACSRKHVSLQWVVQGLVIYSRISGMKRRKSHRPNLMRHMHAYPGKGPQNRVATGVRIRAPLRWTNIRVKDCHMFAMGTWRARKGGQSRVREVLIVGGKPHFRPLNDYGPCVPVWCCHQGSQGPVIAGPIRRRGYRTGTVRRARANARPAGPVPWRHPAPGWRMPRSARRLRSPGRHWPTLPVCRWRPGSHCG